MSASGWCLLVGTEWCLLVGGVCWWIQSGVCWWVVSAGGYRVVSASGWCLHVDTEWCLLISGICVDRLPRVSLPDVRLVPAVLVDAFSIAVVSFASNISLMRLLRHSQSHTQPVHANQASHCTLHGHTYTLIALWLYR